MPDTTLKQGDVVVLNTGTSYSPMMVVKYINDDESICVWYNSTTHQFEDYKFPNATIKKV